MEYCQSGDLARIIQQRKATNLRLTENEVMQWFVQVALALKYTHSRRK